MPKEEDNFFFFFFVSNFFGSIFLAAFNYQRGLYTVFELNYSTYVNCSFNIWYGKDWMYNWTNKGGKTKLVLNETKIYYFACGLDNHCQQGVKVAVNVTNSDESSSSLQASSDPNSSHAASRTPIQISITALALLIITSSIALLPHMV